MNSLHNFLFGIFPYIALSVFLFGSLFRYEREQYSWKSDSSQLLSKKGLRLASNLFHFGIIGLFFGHAVGLLTPHKLFLTFGISDIFHQWIAIVAGTIFGGLCLLGGILLWIRRMGNQRIRINSRQSDIIILAWLIITAAAGLYTVPVSIHHATNDNAETMILLAEWAQSIVTFSPMPELILNVSSAYKFHLFMGMSIFFLFPFTRLVHVWSVPIGYLGRTWQIVRARRTV